MSENYLGYALISLNTAPTPKNLFLMIIEKHIWIIWNASYKSSSNSPSIQVLRQQIRGGGGSRLVLILLTQGGVGGPTSGKSCWRNTWMLPYLLITQFIQRPTHKQYFKEWPRYLINRSIITNSELVILY